MDFEKLNPDFMLDVISAQGFRPAGNIFQLNSYENRVYEIPLEDGEPIIAKFYRPNRWSEATLKDEHLVLKELKNEEIPVIRPLILNDQKGFETLSYADPFYYCLYPKFRGHEEAELNNDHRKWIGRTLARLHNVTSHLQIENRIELSSKTYGDDVLPSIFEKNYVPDEIIDNLESTIHQCLDLIDPILNQDWQSFAVHGDCHLGNILWNFDGPTLVDFDDMVIAPAVQDIWMLFHGNETEQAQQKAAFFEGYEMFRCFDQNSFILTEPLRTLRMIRHAAWIGERFEEEIFRSSFPYYTEITYWQDLLLSLKEQLAALQELSY